MGRIICAIYIWGLVVWSCTLTQDSRGTFMYTFIYFTMQTCTFCALYFTVAAASTIVFKSNCAPVNISLFKIAEFFQSLAPVLGVFVKICRRLWRNGAEYTSAWHIVCDYGY